MGERKTSANDVHLIASQGLDGSLNRTSVIPHAPLSPLIIYLSL